MIHDWVDALRPLANAACAAARCPQHDAVVFYLARWCQKLAHRARVDVRTLEREDIQDAAGRIARNLTADGDRVERLCAADPAAIAELDRQLLGSAAPRVGAAAGDYVEEARQKILLVLLTGTRPSRAGEQRELAGPSNEYVFSSPFEYWARCVAIRMILDEARRVKRERARGLAQGQRRSGETEILDPALLREALVSLPALLEAIDALPGVQRSVLTSSLCRSEVDDEARDHIHELAPELFSELLGVRFDSDGEIADHLGTTTRLVAANRSLARVKLSEREPLWELLLDALLPHRTTRPRAAAADPGRHDG